MSSSNDGGQQSPMMLESDYESDDPVEKITKIKEKLRSHSSAVASWHQKCVNDESTLLDLNNQINSALFKLARYKCLSASRKRTYDKLCVKEDDATQAWLADQWHEKGRREGDEMALNEGFDAFCDYLHSTRKECNWDYISPRLVNQIVKDGGEYSEHEHVKAAYKGNSGRSN